MYNEIHCSTFHKKCVAQKFNSLNSTISIWQWHTTLNFTLFNIYFFLLNKINKETFSKKYSNQLQNTLLFFCSSSNVGKPALSLPLYRLRESRCTGWKRVHVGSTQYAERGVKVDWSSTQYTVAFTHVDRNECLLTQYLVDTTTTYFSMAKVMLQNKHFFFVVKWIMQSSFTPNISLKWHTPSITCER